jgi:hypothetical protein
MRGYLHLWSLLTSSSYTLDAYTMTSNILTIQRPTEGTRLHWIQLLVGHNCIVALFSNCCLLKRMRLDGRINRTASLGAEADDNAVCISMPPPDEDAHCTCSHSRYCYVVFMLAAGFL